MKKVKCYIPHFVVKKLTKTQKSINKGQKIKIRFSVPYLFKKTFNFST